MKPFNWPDARGWIGLGCYVLVLIILLMIWGDRSLLNNDFFKVIATALVLTAWNNGPVGWAYQATKSGGELADRNADIVRETAKPTMAIDPPAVITETKTTTVAAPEPIAPLEDDLPERPSWEK